MIGKELEILKELKAINPRVYTIFDSILLFDQFEDILNIKDSGKYRVASNQLLEGLILHVLELIKIDKKGANAAINVFKERFTFYKQEALENAVFNKKDSKQTFDRIKKFESSFSVKVRLSILEHGYNTEDLPTFQNKYFEDNSIYESDDLGYNNHLKLNWKGTAGEFAAIIDLLIEKGFIEDIPQKNNKANLCLQLFNIKNQRTGEQVAPRTLAECFGKDKHTFYPDTIKIPNSVTFGKEQIPARKQNGNRTEKGG